MKVYTGRMFTVGGKIATMLVYAILSSSMLDSLHSEEQPDRTLPASAYIQQLAIDRHNPETLFAATIGAGLFKSTNGGLLWKAVNRESGILQFFVVVIDPGDNLKVYSGGNGSGLWVSEDGGENWERAGLAGVTICDLVIDPSNPDRLFVLAPEGIYRKQDGESDWNLVFNYRSFLNENWSGDYPEQLWEYSRFQKIAVNPHDPRSILIGARWEGGLHRSDDGGDTWRHEWISGIFRRVDQILFHPQDPDVIFVGTHHQGLFKSYNRGKSWISMSRGIEPQIRTPYYGAYLISGLTMEPGNPQVLYTGSDYSNWKSLDGGLSWREVGKTLTCEFARTFAVDPHRTNIVYAGTNIGIYKSFDGGESWIAVNNGFPERKILQILDAEIDEKKFQYALVEGRPAVYRREVTEKEDWLPMSWLLYEEGDSIWYDADAQVLSLRTPKGVIRSYDGGFRWDIESVSYAAAIAPSPRDPVCKSNTDPSHAKLRVKIVGDVFFQDTLVDPLYRRPPYVSLQLVTSNYPCNRSEPLWSGNWESSLDGCLSIPGAVFSGGRDYILYVEVRDFQRNTLVGYTPVDPDSDDVLVVRVDPAIFPPCLNK